MNAILFKQFVAPNSQRVVVEVAVALRENDVKVMDIFFFLFVNHGLDISLLKLLLKD